MTTAQAPVYPADVYSDDALHDPYPHYRAIRDLGPAVWLPEHGAYAVGRYADARAVLLDGETFRSAHGIALNEPANDAILGCTLASDGERHAHLRRVVAHRLTARSLAPIREAVTAGADALVDELVARGSFDAVTDLAQALPLSVVPDFIGWPREGREHLLRWAAANFDSFGPMNARTERALPQCGEMAAYGSELVRTGNVLPGSLGAGVLESRDRGDIDTEQAMMLMLDYLAPSLDTTISAVGSAIWLFGNHPEQWDRVRADPRLVAGAANEVVRLEAPVRAFGRITVRDTEIGGVPIAESSRVLVIYASANRDERRWDRPDEFDVGRPDSAQQLGYGYGEHGCAGQALARMEIEALLAALARSVTRFELGTPQRALNNVIRAFGSLPVRVLTG
ncbi:MULTISPECIES: cytochrome P450 [Pseudonocardia]|uniref:Steroid C26-monooxygenase n=2 Tax=Pseudonocardia TaxID=1847 RepID=A0A1Y2MM99_PSEAH|nr:MULTISPECIES: cytochrome P450 [Pseudonocardia]OSY36385.1 Steroid C26-monooxygenase [Pseudonocardia autotrophica]TDN72659.1 cytochrome P450 [Pseudonocardia autotrophica]BBG03372.1 cytochrome P450 [Pseudonocardia autotrophica]GEC27273.1 cytochrome P450 [Pseudonocardia saturnea]